MSPTRGRVSTLGQVVAERRRGRFVGRMAELELVRAAFDAAEPPFSVLWFVGPGGIGKTSLLEAIAEEALAQSRAASGDTVMWLDGRSLPTSPRAVTDMLGRHIDVPPGDAGIEPTAGRLILIVDAYERLQPLDDWFRTRLLPRLPRDALVVLAGRNPPGQAWREDAGWRELLRVVSLRNFDPEESRSYLAACGIPEADRERLVEITHGHPLGLSLLTDVVLRGGEAALGPAAPDLVSTLVGRFVDVVPDDLHRSALEVCSLAWVTTEDLLRHALGLADAHEVFAWLRQLSFIESGPDGLQPHDLARDVLDADLRWRDPEGYKATFRRVRAHTTNVLRSSRGRDQQIAGFDIKFLFRNLPGVTTPVDWTTWGRQVTEPARPADHAAILDLVEQAEGAASAGVAERWLALQPDGFVVVRDEVDDVRGVIGLIDLTAAAEADRRADPGAAAAWDQAYRQAPPRRGEQVTQTRFVVDREAYQGPSPTMNVVPVVTLMRYLRMPTLAWDFLTLFEPDHLDEFFALADLRRASGADFVLGDRRYGLFGHDFRRVPVDALMELWTERALAHDAALTPATPEGVGDQPVVLSQTEFTDAVRQALRDIHRPELLGRSPLLRTRLLHDRSGSAEPGAESLAGLLRDAVEVLGQDPRDVKLQRAVERTYLQPAPTQEAAAEVLGLPFSTYRRHLTQGVARVVAILWDWEVYGTSPRSGSRP